MKKALRLPLLAAALIVLTGAVALHAAASPPNHANRFGATFSETNVSRTNRIADLGVLQIINTATGTVEGFGAATMLLAMSQDRSVQPCGPGSFTNAGIRRIVLDSGVLMLRTVAYACQTPSGLVATETWTVDGPSSTGVFADARGSGEGTVNISTSPSVPTTTTLTGKLKLAEEDD